MLHYVCIIAYMCFNCDTVHLPFLREDWIQYCNKTVKESLPVLYLRYSTVVTMGKQVKIEATAEVFMSFSIVATVLYVRYSTGKDSLTILLQYCIQFSLRTGRCTVSQLKHS